MNREPVVLGVAVLAIVNFAVLVFGLPEIPVEVEIALVGIVDAVAAVVMRGNVTPV